MLDIQSTRPRFYSVGPHTVYGVPPVDLVERTPGPPHVWPEMPADTDSHEYVLTFCDAAGDPLQRVSTVRLSELSAFTAAYRCSPECVGFYCRQHTYTSQRVPAEPTLLDLLGWSL